MYKLRKGYKPTEHLIRISKVYRQKLGDMTEEDALKEGDFTLSEFKSLWKNLCGIWNENEVVWVIEFECLQ